MIIIIQNLYSAILPLGGYRGAGGTGRQKESQFNTAGGSEFQVRGAAVLNDRLENDIQV